MNGGGRACVPMAALEVKQLLARTRRARGASAVWSRAGPLGEESLRSRRVFLLQWEESQVAPMLIEKHDQEKAWSVAIRSGRARHLQETFFVSPIERLKAR